MKLQAVSNNMPSLLRAARREGDQGSMTEVEKLRGQSERVVGRHDPCHLPGLRACLARKRYPTRNGQVPLASKRFFPESQALSFRVRFHNFL